MAGPLDLLPLHTHAEMRSAPKKEFMVVSSGIRTLRDATESVQIELTLKGSQLGLTKVSISSRVKG